jgi:prepilin-type N-terminal cleavage/methylation domain-containing protein/prepilin-type processing-associated H-X9-DG protein
MKESTPYRPAITTRRSGFTLIELLVVVAIIALLLGILTPALSHAQAVARSVRCLSHTRTIALVMQMYADQDSRRFYPTARMPMDAPIETSWIYLTKPLVDQIDAYRCPADRSSNWESPMMPRPSSYGINAYFTPNHPPYNGITPSQIRNPSETIIAAELIEDVAMDHFMPMYFGTPAAVTHATMQSRQWDADTATPTKIKTTRHIGTANYVFTDGHAATHDFAETWHQEKGSKPTRDWYDPK